MRKKDVYSLDPLSGLRTNQQFSSFKLKIHTETANSTVFGQNPRFSSKTTDFRIKTAVFGHEICGFRMKIHGFQKKIHDFWPKTTDFDS